MSIINELQRRNVFKVAAAYVVVGWLTMQAGEVMAPALNLPEWVVSMLAFFLLLGFPLAVLFAWAFELTPDGIRREKDVDRSQSITGTTGQKLNYTIIVLLAAAVGLFAWDKFLREPLPAGTAEQLAAETHSIAVLPLADMSQDGDHEYFSDGLTEELLNILAQISDLRVAGRTSSFAFKGKNEDLRNIGQKLNVESILEGSVRKDTNSNRVRITLQLINVENGYHLWSETYNRQLDDIFAIQEEVALQVASALRITLLGEDQQRIEQTSQLVSTDTDAYDLYLQGLNELNKSGHINLERALALFGQVLAQDPDYLPARLGLLDSWAQQSGTGAMTSQEFVRRASPQLETLLAQMPENAHAHRLKAKVHEAEGDTENAQRAFEKALGLAPSEARNLQEYGRFLFDTGRPVEGMTLIDTAARLEPYNAQIRFDQCQTNAYAERLEPALSACDALIEINPEGPQGYYGKGLAYLYQGDLAKGVEYFTRSIEKDPADFEMLAGQSVFWVAMGDSDQALEWLNRAEAIATGEPLPTVARVLYLEYTEQFDRAGALAQRALERGLENRHGSDVFLRRANAAAALREDNVEQALAPYRKQHPWAFETNLQSPPQLDFFSAHEIVRIAALMKLVDPVSERPGQLVTLAEETWAQNDELQWFAKPTFLASIAVVRGDLDQAMDALKDMPVQMYWRSETLYDPVISQLKEHPGFQPFIASIEQVAEANRQRAHQLLDMEP